MELDLIINSKRRYENFIKRVLKSGIVWGLENEKGWFVCESNEYEDIEVMPFWSDEAMHDNVQLQFKNGRDINHHR